MVVRCVRDGRSRGVGCGRLGLKFELELVKFEVESGRERMVKEVRRGMGRSLKVFVDGNADVDVDVGVEFEAERAVVVEEGEVDVGGMEMTIRFVIGSAV